MVIQWDEPEAENGPIEVNIKRSRGHFLSYKSCQSINPFQKLFLKKFFIIISFFHDVGIQGVLYNQSKSSFNSVAIPVR